MFKHLGRHPAPAHCLPLLFPESHSLLLLIKTTGFACGDDDPGRGGVHMCANACSVIIVFIHFPNSLNLFLLQAVVQIFLRPLNNN